MARKRIIRTRRYSTPCGDLLLGAIDGKLCLCSWLAGRRYSVITRRLQRVLRAGFAPVGETSSADTILNNADNVLSSADTSEDRNILSRAAAQLDEYFAGRRTRFDIPLLPAGTPFQETVWRRLLEIPFGQTLSYASLARAISSPSAVRAVANANAANAITIFVPCHRVVSASGLPGGYSGGLAAKRFLLRLEGLNY